MENTDTTKLGKKKKWFRKSLAISDQEKFSFTNLIVSPREDSESAGVCGNSLGCHILCHE
jgi:hypothetical protein